MILNMVIITNDTHYNKKIDIINNIKNFLIIKNKQKMLKIRQFSK